MISRAVKVLLLSACCVLPQASAAQNFPERPIRLILGVAAGGGQDTVARAMAPRLSKEIGTNIIVDNRPGAGGTIGAELAKRASPDGYTLLMISSSNIIHPLMYGGSYDVLRDFASVGQLVTQPYLLVVTPSLPVKSVSELISHAKTHPGKLNFGSAGSGTMTHFAAELFADQAKIDAVHVPYKGTGAVYPDLIGGRLQFSFVTIVSAQPHIQANRLRPLAVSSEKRSKSLSMVPTVAEAGLPGYKVTQWYGVLAPSGTPRGVITKLNKALVDVIESPEMSKHLANDGADANGSSPNEFAALLKMERERWRQLIERTGLMKGK